MHLENRTERKHLAKGVIEAAFRIGLIAVLVFLCLRVIAPFADLALWSVILAVALYPLHLRLAERLGGRQGLSATLLVLVGLVVIGAPTAMIGDSLAEHAQDGYRALESGSIAVPPPPESVAGWPIIGERLFNSWSAAAGNLPAFLEQNDQRVAALSKVALGAAANSAVGLLVFVGALAVAGVIMAFGAGGDRAMRRILVRLAGPTMGVTFQNLATATIRSVATGVIGVAFIQALLLGVGFILAGVPGAPVLALVVLLIGILQLPALIISLPVIVYLWAAGDASAVSNIAFSIYFLVAGMADNVLKPLLLGRGVDAPMPIILIGALGGMATAGIIGLFTGAVLLAVGYQLFMAWVDAPEETGDGDQADGDTSQQP